MLKWRWKKIGDKMAKRKKKVENKRILALELYKGFLKAEPDLADQAKAAIEDFKAQGAKWDENIVYCPNDKILLEIKKARMGEPDAKYFKRLRNATAGLISAVATWDLSKVIYRFDEDFYSELRETEGIEKVPVNMLLHLPYKCLCLQVGDESRFTYLNYDFEFKLYELRIERLFFNDDEDQPGLINLLKQYNFTIEENSPTDAVISLDPELLGRVFENLLAAYNPETQESARKSTGSFYTPRPIVDYMVDEAIKSYLLGKRLDRISEEKLNALFKERTVSTDWTDSNKDAIANALKQVKILDPACGSGAFPMGCLLRIVDIIELLKGDTVDRYQLKLTIIENCVYGVDIQPIAMLICKLRFFISLICEQNDIDFSSPETNFGINTLPNLETKFVAANTLISANIRNYEDDWTNDEKLDSMKEKLLCIRNDHFLAKGRVAKKRSERQDNATRQQLLDYIVSHAQKPDLEKIAAHERLLQQLSDEWELYKDEV